MALLRCKFKTVSIEAAKNADGSVASEKLRLEAITGQYTPSGNLELTITVPDAFGKLKPDQELYLDLVPASEEG
jgi:hypothetical protein